MPPGSLNRAPIKRDASFPESSHYLSQFPVNGPPPQVPQWDPYEERHPSTEPSTSHLLKINLSLGVPSKGAPSMFPSRVPIGEIETVTRATGLSIHVCLPKSPQKEEPSYKMGKNIRSPSTEPHAAGKLTYNGVQPGSPRGLLTTLLSLCQCHAALGTIPSILPLVDQSPISHHVS